MAKCTVEHLELSRQRGFGKPLFGLVLVKFLGCNSNHRVLDIGCGTGFFTRILARNCGAYIVGMDIDNQLLKAAKSIASEENLIIEFKVGDITQIPELDGSFDIVMSDIMLERFRGSNIGYPKGIEAPIREMKRVCKENGVVACIEPFYRSSFTWDPWATPEENEVLLKYTSVNARWIGAGPTLPSLFQSVGLKEIELITWFWGGIANESNRNRNLDHAVMKLEERLQKTKNLISECSALSEEDKAILFAYWRRKIKYLKQTPEQLLTDMTVNGLQVFITKGRR